MKYYFYSHNMHPHNIRFPADTKYAHNARTTSELQKSWLVLALCNDAFFFNIAGYGSKTKLKLRGFSPQANNTDRPTAAFRRS
jgi:hypothetical protein